MPHTPVSALVAALTLVLAPVGSAVAAPDGARIHAGTYAQQARDATNQARADNGLRPLKKSTCLQRYAVKQASAMAAQREVFHQDLGAVLTGCQLTSAGENVAAGFRNGNAVVKGWMGSEGHRANILTPGFRLMGLASRQSGNGTWYVAQVFGSKG